MEKVFENIYGRRSVRKYTEKQVPKGLLEKIAEDYFNKVSKFKNKLLFDDE